ncbi:hypothetical protein [Turicimonas sp. TL08]
MADKKIQLQDYQGNNLFPKTKAELVTTADGGNLASAQENKIETISLNGKEIQIVNKKVNIEIPAAAEYSIAKAASADDGFSATYYLTKDGEQVGQKINIPKDMVVQSGTVKTCETADAPLEGLKVGDKYIDLVLANAEDSHIYIKVTDLVDVYTPGEGINIENNQVSVDTSKVAMKTDLTSLATKEALTGLETKVNAKADKATTLAGYGITDGISYVEVTE